MLANSEPRHRLGEISRGVERRAERNKTGLRTRRGPSAQISRLAQERGSELPEGTIVFIPEVQTAKCSSV